MEANKLLLMLKYFVFSYSPIPAVYWFHNGVEITGNDSRYGINPFLPWKLTINKMDSSMAGQYKCHARNRAGRKETSANVELVGM